MKKALSVFFSLLMLMSVVPMYAHTASAAAQTTVPDGYIPVYTVDDLYAVRNNRYGNYILMNNIDMTDAVAPGGYLDCGSGWLPICSSYSDSFAGIFDGNGYSIEGMRIENSSESSLGLFGYIAGGTVKNLRMVNPVIKDTWAVANAGAVVGYLNYGTIENIAVDNLTMAVHYTDRNDSYTGGIAGYAWGYSSSYIRKCYVTGSVSSVNSYGYVSGILGCAGSTKVKITDCYNEADVFGYDYVSGIGNRCAVSNCINTGNTMGGKFYQDSGIAWNSSIIKGYYLQGTASKGSYNTSDSVYTSVALTAAQMTMKSVFSSLDFNNIWFIDTSTGINHPQLKAMPQTATISIASLPTTLPSLHYDELDVTGMMLNVQYGEDGSINTKKVSADMISGYDPSVLGEQTVTVTYMGQKASFTVCLAARPASSVSLSASSASINVGKTKTVSATVLPDTATDKSVTWSSSDTSVATVSSAGVITAVSKGTATITATTANGKKASCTVTVNVPATSVSVTPESKTLCVGKPVTLKAAISPAASTDTVKWTSSDNKICAVDENGKVTAVSEGTAKIKATAGSGAYAYSTITVKKHTYTNSCDTTCNACKAERTIKHTYSNACDSSCNVCGETRTVSGHKYSNSCDVTCNECDEKRTIKHTYTNSCDTTCNVCKEKRTIKHTYTNSCDKTCNVCKATRTIKHTYTNSCDTTCNVCKEKRTIKHTYSNSCDKTCNVCKATRTIKHTYSNACDKTCNVCGATRTPAAHKYSNKCDTTCNVCKAKRTIKHTYSNSCDETCNVCNATRTVSHKLKSTTTNATLKANGSVVKKCTVCGKVESKTTIKSVKTVKLSATVYAYDGKVKSPTVTVKDSAGKTLKKDTDYTVTYAKGRKNVGEYKVTVTLKGKYSGTKTLTFSIVPTKKTSVSLYAGEKSAIGAKSNTKITYKSSDTAIAKVSSSGVITAVKAGTATITVTSNKISKKITVKVTKPSISISAGSSTVKVGGTISFNATVKPSTAKVKWSVNNSSVAAISSSGVLTGRSAGTVTVTGSITVGGKTYKDTYKVTVKTAPAIEYPNVEVYTTHHTEYDDLYGFIITNKGSSSITVLAEGNVSCDGDSSSVYSLYANSAYSQSVTVNPGGRQSCLARLYRPLYFYESLTSWFNIYVEYKGETFRLECRTSEPGTNKCYNIVHID